MRPPPGFAPPRPHFVCKLQKSLYGLWQAPRQWYFKLASALQDYRFKQSSMGHSLFIYNHNGVFLVLLIYVDDLVLTGNNPTHCEAFKVYLNKCFKLKDHGSSIFWALKWLIPPKDFSYASENIPWTFLLKPSCNSCSGPN